MSRKRHLCYTLLFLLLFSLATSFSLRTVHGDVSAEILNVEHPEEVMAGSVFEVVTRISFTTDEPIWFHVTIIDDEGDEQGTGSIHTVADEGVERSLIGRCHLELLAREELGDWHLTAVLEEFDSEHPFTVRIIETEDYYARILELEGRADTVYMGEGFTAHCTYEFRMPGSIEGNPVNLQLLYRDSIFTDPRMILDLDIEETGRTDSGSWAHRAGRENWPKAPIRDESYIWTWYFWFELSTPEGPQVLDERSVDVEVLPHEEPWAKLFEPRYSQFVRRGEIAEVAVPVGYDVPEPDELTLSLEITWADGDPIEGGREMPLGDLTGRGRILEYFSLNIPSDVETEAGSFIGLRVLLKSAGGVIDERDIRPLVTESGTGDYLRIDSISVIDSDGERFELPEQQPEILIGSSFTVSVHLSFSLSWDTESGRRDYDMIICTVEDWFGAFAQVSTDSITVWPDQLEGRCDLEIPSHKIPRLPGVWPLNAYAYTPVLRIHSLIPFQVTLVEDPARPLNELVRTLERFGADTDEEIDWSLDPVEVIPADPFEGDEVFFQTSVRADPLPEADYLVWISCYLDDDRLFRDQIPYEAGLEFTQVEAAEAWTATVGDHTVEWIIEEEDPEDNNRQSLDFTVIERPIEEEEEIPREEEPTPAPTEPPPFQPPPTDQMEEEFDFYITVNPTEQTMQSTVSYAVSVTPLSKTTKPVKLTLLKPIPSLSYLFNPPQGTPPYASTLILTPSSHLPAGLFSFIIEASSEEKTRYKHIVLHVKEGPSYRLTVTPQTITANPGQTVDCKITVESDNGYTQYVNLIVTDLPRGMLNRIEPSAIKPDFQSTLYMEVGEDVSPGTYNFIVRGSGPEPHQVRSTLLIREEVSERPMEETEGRALEYYLPLLYLIAIIVAILGGSVYGVKRLRKSRKPKVFCIECGEKIPIVAKICPKCGEKQEV